MKKESSHIEDKVKQAFVHQQRKAPLDLWDSISNSVDLTEEENSIRESFKKQERSAPDGIWNEINRQLTIDDVWTRIEIKENRRRRVGMIWWLAASVSVLLLVIGFMKTRGTDALEKDPLVASSKQMELMPPSTSPAETHPKQGTQSNEETDEAVSTKLNSTSTSSKLTNTGPIHRQSNEEVQRMDDSRRSETSYGLETSPPPLSNHPEEAETELAKEVNNEDQMETLGSVVLETKRPSTILNSVDRTLMELSEMPKVIEERTFKWEVGLTAAPSNSWLFDNKVRSGFRRNSLVSNEVSGGLDLGLNVAFHPRAGSSIQIKYDFVSIMNQRFEEYQSGRLLDVRTQVRQQKVSMSYLHTHPNVTFGNQRLMFGGGLFYSYITSVERTSANNLLNEYDLAKNNFGFNLQSGFQGNWGRFTYRYGIFSDIGLLNVTSPSAIVPKKFNATNTFNIGAFGTISYKF